MKRPIYAQQYLWRYVYVYVRNNVNLEGKEIARTCVYTVSFSKSFLSKEIIERVWKNENRVEINERNTKGEIERRYPIDSVFVSFPIPFEVLYLILKAWNQLETIYFK